MARPTTAGAASAAPEPGPEAAGWAAGLRVQVTRSARRRKTVAARLVGDVVHITVPATLPPAEEADHIATLVARLARKHRSAAVDLDARAAAVARRYGLPQATSVRWVSNQSSRWGSCSTGSGAIRISDRVAGFPPWVLDYVLVHELAHLVHADHGPGFHDLVARYPLAERARGYLMAKSGEDDAW